MLTVNFPPANIEIGNISSGPDGSVSLQVLLLANGNENALGFSLNFSTALLSLTTVSLGDGAAAASLVLNTNQVGAGSLGAALSLSSGSTFAPGTQDVLNISFAAAVLTNPTLAALSFADSPTRRQLSDPSPASLAANFINGTVLIPASEFEGDVFPRPEGDEAVTITDWVLIGRYAARLDYPTNASEYQRADCAPRSTSGDGAITVADWVQAGRYVVGLDPASRAGGPTNDLGPGLVVSAGGLKPGGQASSPQPKGLSPRQIRIANGYLAPGEPGTVSVLLEAQGNENAIGFSLGFDPSAFTYNGVSLGANAAGASIDVNATQAASGKIALILALQTGSSFSPGTKEIVQVALTPTNAALGSYALGFTDQPVVRQVVDPT
ncbi:MAG: hypothetical protein ACREIC_33255, partial [Limisphaerales bacterium]